MSSRFDEIIDRRGSGCYKWDAYDDSPNMISMWVADMDFRIPDVVRDAVAGRNSHSIYGYPVIPPSYIDSFVSWISRRFSTTYQRGWVIPINGVLGALSIALAECTDPDAPVIIQPPIYPPFFSVVERNGRTIHLNELIQIEGGRYAIDFGDLERACSEGARTLLFCSPHNPVARVWTRDELDRLLDLVEEYGLTVLSDEIHQDLILGDRQQLPLVGLWMDRGGNPDSCPIISITAATKTFNLAGLSCGYLVAPNPVLRKQITDAIARSFGGMLNTLSMEATIAAYTHAESWLDELLEYLKDTANEVNNRIDRAITPIPHTMIEGTYLLWMDLRAYGDDPTLDRILLERAQVRFNDGSAFGAPGFRRANLAAPRSVVVDGVDRMLEALAQEGAS